MGPCPGRRRVPALSPESLTHLSRGKSLALLASPILTSCFTTCFRVRPGPGRWARMAAMMSPPVGQGECRDTAPATPGGPTETLSTFHLLELPVQLPQLLLLLQGPGGDPAPGDPGEGQKGGEGREEGVAAPSPAPLTPLPPAGCCSPWSSRRPRPGSSRRAAPQKPFCWWLPAQRTCPG